MIKVVWVALIVVLQFVKEVQEIEGECRRRSFNCRGEPVGMKELCMPRNTGPHITAVAVTNNKTVNAPKVEHHQVEGTCRTGTRIIGAVAELNDKAESSEGSVFKKHIIPFLRYT